MLSITVMNVGCFSYHIYNVLNSSIKVLGTGIELFWVFTHYTLMCVGTVYSERQGALKKEIIGVLVRWDSNPRPLQ